LPIGFLLIAVIFIWIKVPGRAVKIALGLGALAAIVSVMTGLMLANSEGYSDEVTLHKWAGITLAIVSVGMCFIPEQHLKLGSIVMTVLIFATGHFGGTLTHGPLITEPEADNLDLSKIDVDNAVFYNDALSPIFEARCYGCHGDTKQKGRLRLDSQDAINKGGKNGHIIVPGNPEESEIVKRISMPLDDEDHMPPKEKRQLTDQEKKLISLWIAAGADFNQKITKEQIAEVSESSGEALELPDVSVSSPDEDLIAKLIEQSVAITRVAVESNFLQVNFISVPNETQQLLETLKPIAKNVVILKLNGTNVQSLIDFENLVNLNLADTKVTDAVIDQIVKCKSLQSLNLSGTKITNVKKLAALEKLGYLNVYNTSIRDELPNVRIEKGNYEVPTLESDTTEVKTN
jgi:mono/diheme cytochrome c family protein